MATLTPAEASPRTVPSPRSARRAAAQLDAASDDQLLEQFAAAGDADDVNVNSLSDMERAAFAADLRQFEAMKISLEAREMKSRV